jgi:hypothetical protein
MMNFTLKGFAGAIGPFVPLAVGIMLKFSLFDKPTTDLATFFKHQYITGIWIDFIVTAYISGVAWLLTRKKGDVVDPNLVVVLLVLPLICSVFCMLFSLGLPKAGFGEFFTLYLPALIAAFKRCPCRKCTSNKLTGSMAWEIFSIRRL